MTMKTKLGFQKPEKKLQKIIDKNYKEMFKELSNFIGINYTVMDKEGNFIAKNDYFSNEFPKVKKATELKEAWNDCLNVMKKGKKIIKEESYKNKYFVSIKKPIFDDKRECVGIMVFSHEITANKQAEIRKKEFIKSIHHDIKTPFAGLHMLSGGMLERETDSIKRKNLAIINMCAKRMMNYFNKILEVVSAEDNKIIDEKINFNVREVVQCIFEMTHPLIIEKKLKLEIDCPPLFVKGSKTIFEHVCLNLISNAVKFTEKGTIKIIVKLENKKSLKLSVIDEGIGIAKEHYGAIFEKFYRITPSYLEPEFLGAGLGLNIVKELVEKAKGKITVKSAISKGSTFNVSLPIQA